jgi:LmbE family N-acetylglucosaminyl deacetylase
MTDGLSGRVVVVSPHSDDAVLSLAATMARAARSGSRVEVLTVFAGDVASDRPANGWDRRAGFATEGEAMAANRDEDRAACRVVGAEASWLAFPKGGYVKGKDEDAVWSEVARAAEGADALLVPGFPLTNPDHEWLSRLLVERPVPCRGLGLYAEQPYRHMVRRERSTLELPAHVPRGSAEWTRAGFRPAEYRLKRRAILAYRSQLPMLGFSQRRHRKLHLMLLHEALRRGEAVAWLAA